MTGSRIINEGRPPSHWVAEMAGKGIHISERKLRERARALGECHVLGKAMLILPEQFDRIFEEPQCHSKPTDAEKHGGSKVGAMASTLTSEKAFEHLTKRSQRRRSGKSNARPGNVLSLVTTRQG